MLQLQKQSVRVDNRRVGGYIMEFGVCHVFAISESVLGRC